MWHITTREKIVYLTFDDGPHPTITPWVLQQLKNHDAAATFFCIGNNVEKHPAIYQSILNSGHSVGNHTYNHVNGWKTETKQYLQDAEKAATVIDSNLFRPPYGRIKTAQAKGLDKVLKTKRPVVVMWDVLSADFDVSLSPKQCAANVLKNTRPGSIIVFHDSEKAFRNLSYALPLTLKTLKKAGYKFGKIIIKTA